MEACSWPPAVGSRTAWAEGPLHLLLSAAGNIALHALYSPSISGTSLLAGAAVMGLTFAVPYQASQGGMRTRGSAGQQPAAARPFAWPPSFKYASFWAAASDEWA